jgi:hypothetical protein
MVTKMNPNKPMPKLRRTPRDLLARLTRATVTSFVVLVCFGTIASRRVYAEVNDSALHFGDQLLRLHETPISGDVGGDFYRLHVNGQPIDIASGTTSRSSTFMLDYFERQCREHADGMKDQFVSLQTTLDQDTLPAGEGYKGLGTLRSERGPRGFVVCFAEGRSVSDADKAERVTQAAKTTDLSRLGDMRYVVVEDIGQGSHIVAAWTHGSFDLGKIFPKEGDVPGVDISTAPRPAGSRRVLSASADGAPFGLIAYEATGGEEQVTAGVGAALAKAGWTKAAGVPVQLTSFGEAYSLGNLDLFVSTAPGATRGKTSVSYTYSQMIGSASGGARAD